MAVQQKYLFGYGSLIQEKSRKVNLPNATEPIPVRVNGWRRAWSNRGTDIGFRCTFLGATPDPSLHVNGVLVPVDDKELPALDRRESGYKRVPVNLDAIEWLDGGSSASKVSEVVVYQTTELVAAEESCPIIQSYIDICLEGCFQIGELLGVGDEFALEFLNTTFDWSSHWVNDRLFPRAPFRYVPQASKIDKMLRDCCPTHFEKIRIE